MDSSIQIPCPGVGANSAMATLLRMTFKHTADVITTMMGVVAQHYKIDPEEMMEVVRAHPRFQELPVEPVIHDLTMGLSGTPATVDAAPAVAVSVAPAAAPAAPAVAKKRGPKKLTEMTAEERAAHDAKVAERKAAASAAAVAKADPSSDPIAVEEPTAPAAEPVAAEPPKVMKVFKIKPKAPKDA